MSEFDTFKAITPLIAWDLLAKKQRVTDGLKILLDVAKESADWFPPLKSALGGVSAVIKHYEVLDESVDVSHIWLIPTIIAIQRRQGEDQRS